MSKYNVGDKFVLEIKEVESGKAGEWYLNDSPIRVDSEFLDALAQLDSDYVNEHFGELQDEAYVKGLNDGQNNMLDWSKQNENDSYKEGFTSALSIIEKLINVPSEAREPLMYILGELERESLL